MEALRKRRLPWKRLALRVSYFVNCRKRQQDRLRLTSALVFAAGSYTFQQECEPETAADAECCESESRLALLHFVDQRGRDTNAGATDWMAQCDRAAIHV